MHYQRKTIDILISDELRDILNVIKTESLVASLLLKTRHNVDNLVDSPINFISISHKDRSKLSYLTQDRIDNLDPSEYWTSSRRYIAKPGSFVSKIFKDISPKEVEIFSNLYKTQSDKRDFKFDVVKGDKIRDFYYYENYNSEKGSLGVSCMKHQHCQKYFDLYVENIDNVSLLAMFNNNDRLIGRALLWDFESHKIMDRIYTQNDEELTFHFKQWATDNGYLYKSEQNWYNTLFFEQVGLDKKEIKLEINLPKGRQHYYPYMDTFKFLDLKTDTLYNYLPDDTSNIKVLCSSEGGKNSGDYLVLDGIDRVFRYRNDASYIDYANVWTGRQNIIYSNYNDRYILNRDSYYEELIGDYIFNEENNDKNRSSVLELIEKKRKEKEENTNRKSSKSEYKKSVEAPTLDRLRTSLYGINSDMMGTMGMASFAQSVGRAAREVTSSSRLSSRWSDATTMRDTRDSSTTSARLDTNDINDNILDENAGGTVRNTNTWVERNMYGGDFDGIRPVSGRGTLNDVLEHGTVENEPMEQGQDVCNDGEIDEIIDEIFNNYEQQHYEQLLYEDYIRSIDDDEPF